MRRVGIPQLPYLRLSFTSWSACVMTQVPS